MKPAQGLRRIRSALAVLGFLAAGVLLFADDKSGMRPTVLTVPSGPGSMEGLGGIFTPRLDTGTSTQEIPLKVPPGRGGFAPRVVLAYNSGFGNGIVGLGWRLLQPFITRLGPTRLPFYTDYPLGDGVDNDRDGSVDEIDEFDSYLYEGAEEMVSSRDGEWRCRHEREFARFSREGEGWKVRRRDGAVWRFGVTKAGRVEDGAGRVVTWLVEEMSDSHGNKIHYGYEALDSGAERYLREIRYNDPGVMRVVFDYEPRPDLLSNWRAGFEIMSAFRCTGMRMFAGGDLARSYRLGYAPTGHRQPLSLLTSLTEMGSDGVTALPAGRFEYTEFPGTAVVSVMPQAPAVDLADGDIQLVDLNGDAMPDVIDTRSTPRYFLNQGVGRDGVVGWSGGRVMESAVQLHLGSQTCELADMDGNFRADLVNFFGGGRADLFVVDERLEWRRRGQMEGVEFSFGDRSVRLCDLNGDRLIDAIRTDGSDLVSFLNRGGTNWSARWVSGSPDARLQFGNGTTHLADMNGDRLMDLVHCANESCYYHPGAGYGRFGARVTMKGAPAGVTSDGRLFLWDVNGDGLADVVHVGNRLEILLNLGLDPLDRGRGRLAPAITKTSAYIGAFATFRSADMNGNGTRDIVINGRVDGALALAYMDLSGGERPYLLKRVDNGIGAITTLSYEPSTADLTRDRSGGRPWPDNVPVSIPVVREQRTGTEYSPETIHEFLYHDGYYDVATEEFRGFGRSERIEWGDESAPTLVTSFRFDVGKVSAVLKGALLATEVGLGPDSSVWMHHDGIDNDGDGSVDEVDELDKARLFYREETDWEVRSVAEQAVGEVRKIEFPFVRRRIRDSYELGAGETRRTEFRYEYDDFGNRLLEEELGRVDVLGDERTTRASYSASHASGRAGWLLDRVVASTIFDGAGAVVGSRRHYYDENTELGLVSRGNLTRVEEWVEGERYIPTRRMVYDRYGNVVAIRDGLFGKSPGHEVEVEYDARFHVFPVRETVHTGGPVVPALGFESEYDPRFGAVTRFTDANGGGTAYSLDEFGRIRGIRKPGDEENTVEFEYVLQRPVASGGKVNWIETRSRDGSRGDGWMRSRSFIDGNGRRLLVKAEAGGGGAQEGSKAVVTEAALYGARGNESVRLNPFFSRVAEAGDDLLAFEDIRGRGWEGLFERAEGPVAAGLARADRVELVHDALLRPTRIKNQDGTARRHVYEPLVRIDYDENDNDPSSLHFGTPVMVRSDGMGRVVEVTETCRMDDEGYAVGDVRAWVTRYGYSALGQLTWMVDSQGNTTTCEYDGLGRRKRLGDPDRGESRWVHDDASNLVESVDAAGRRILFYHDGANRIVGEDYLDESESFSAGFRYRPSEPLDRRNRPDVVYFYDVTAGDARMGGEARGVRGRLASVWDTSGEEHFSYDERNRPKWRIKRIRDPYFDDGGNAGVMAEFRTDFSHDPMDRLARVTYPDGDHVEYAHDERGFVSGISGGPTGHLVERVERWPSGVVRSMWYGNGVSSAYVHDERLRLVRAETVRGAEPGMVTTLEFDAASVLGSVRDRRPVSVVPEGDPRRDTRVFRHDDLGRLTEVRYEEGRGGPAPAGNGGRIRYRHDRIGNLLEQTAEAGLSGAVGNTGKFVWAGGASGRWNRGGRRSGDVPGPHAPVSVLAAGMDAVHLEYDAGGAVIQFAGLRMTRDFRGRCVVAEGESSMSKYAFDYSGRRVSKHVRPRDGSGTSRTVLYPSRYFEVRENGEAVKYVLLGDHRVARALGALNTRRLSQRLRLVPGWNLIGFSVAATNVLGQINSKAAAGGEVAVAAMVWDRMRREWRSLSDADAVGVGAVVWVHASRPADAWLSGGVGEEVAEHKVDGGDFLAAPAFRGWPVRATLGAVAGLRGWTYDAFSSTWSIGESPLSASADLLPDRVDAGSAALFRAEAPTRFVMPAWSGRIRYYHEDHLGSTIRMTDGEGGLSEELAYEPFGGIRHRVVGKDDPDPYGFLQTEWDGETGLGLLGARQLASGWGRFLTPDPVDPFSSAGRRLDPQRNHPYAYAGNRPVTRVDPEGADDRISHSVKAKLFKVAMYEEESGPDERSSGAGNRIAFFKLEGEVGLTRAHAGLKFAGAEVGESTRWGEANRNLYRSVGLSLAEASADAGVKGGTLVLRAELSLAKVTGKTGAKLGPLDVALYSTLRLGEAYGGSIGSKTQVDMGPLSVGVQVRLDVPAVLGSRDRIIAGFRDLAETMVMGISDSEPVAPGTPGYIRYGGYYYQLPPDLR